MSFLLMLAESLLLSIASESPIYLLLLPRPASRLILCAVLINAFTNPLANYAYHYLQVGPIPLECAVVLCEGLLISYLAPASFARALLASAAANLLSSVLGLLAWGGV